MRRYRFLKKEDVYEALNRLRDSFLAAKDGAEVEEIIKSLLTLDERLKIGRRILIAECIKLGLTIEEIKNLLKVGKNTVQSVSKLLEQNPIGFELIELRHKIVEKEYKDKKYKTIGGPELVFKRKFYSGFSRKDVKRK